MISDPAFFAQCQIATNRKLSISALGALVRWRTRHSAQRHLQAGFLSGALQNSLWGVPTIPAFRWNIQLRVKKHFLVNSVWFTGWNDGLCQAIQPVLSTKEIPKEGFFRSPLWPSQASLLLDSIFFLSPPFIWHLPRTAFCCGVCDPSSLNLISFQQAKD